MVEMGDDILLGQDDNDELNGNDGNDLLAWRQWYTTQSMAMPDNDILHGNDGSMIH